MLVTQGIWESIFDGTGLLWLEHLRSGMHLHLVDSSCFEAPGRSEQVARVPVHNGKSSHHTITLAIHSVLGCTK